MGSARGYTLIEMLVVVAIIGMISLVGVPAFVTYYQSNKIKAAIREYTTDLRWARQRAVTRNVPVKVSFETGTTDAVNYQIFDGSPTTPTTWTAARNVRSLSDNVYIFSSTFTDIDTTPDGLVDIVFRPDGSIRPRPTETVGGLEVTRTVLRIDNPNIPFNEYTVFFAVSGNLTVDRTKF